MKVLLLWYMQGYTGPGPQMLGCSLSLAAWQQPPLLRPRPEFPYPQYSPDSHLCGPFSFLGRKAQNNDGSSPLTSHSPGITHIHPGNRLQPICHLLVIYTPPQVPWPTPYFFLPNECRPKSITHLGLVLNSLWPVHSVFLGGGSPFWAFASHLCNVRNEEGGSRDCFSCWPALIVRDPDISGIIWHFTFRQTRVQISTSAR